MKVETISMVCMVISLLMTVGLFLGLMLVLKFKFKMKLSTFLTGCGTMFLFAFVLENLMHTIVLKSAGGEVIKGNIWLYATYGAVAAAVFEEAGRFLAMKFVLKKEHPVASTAIMYGAGHGGFEALYIMGIGMVSNIVLALMMNLGQSQLLYAGMDEATSAILTSQLTALCETAPYMFLVGVLERVFAITAHIAMSIFMWKGVTKRKVLFVILPIVMHFILDFVTVIVNNYFGITLTEIVVCVIAMAMILLAKKVYCMDRNAEAIEN